MSQIFTSKESHDSYEKRKDIKCKKWHLVWVSEQETGVIRATQPKPKNTADDNEYRKEVDGIRVTFEGYIAGTRKIFFYEPVGEANQIALRVNGCCCPVCMCSNRETERRDVEYIWGKGISRHQETISTVLPEIFSSNEVTKERINCMFGQIWRSQMLRVKLTPYAIGEVGARAENAMILDAAPEAAAPIDDQEMAALEVAARPIVPVIQELSSITGTEVQLEIQCIQPRERRNKRKTKDDSVADMVHWVTCDSCGKWRVVNRPYAATEAFRCVDLAINDHDQACDVASEWIDPEFGAVAAVKKNKKK